MCLLYGLWKLVENISDAIKNHLSLKPVPQSNEESPRFMARYDQNTERSNLTSNGWTVLFDVPDYNYAYP